MDTFDIVAERQDPADPFDEHKGAIQLMLDNYTNAEIVEELTI